MSCIVMKFGGTSVGDVSRINKVADLIVNYKNSYPQNMLVIVVSAMAGETNRLISLASGCATSPDSREMDVLLASGEQVSIALLSIALLHRGVKAKSLLAGQAGILTEGLHTNALISKINKDQILSLLEENIIPVIAGFQGVDRFGDLTTLGRGGSDITAVAVASALSAKECRIYTDVKGVLSTDPRICKTARLLERLSHDEMLEMASLGAKVLHSRSVYFAMRYKVPLVVLSTFDGDLIPGKNGTWIVSEDEIMEKPLVTGITSRLDEALLTVEGLPIGIGHLAHLFEKLASEGVLIDMITQNRNSEKEINLSFTVPDELSVRALEIVRSLIPQFKARGARIERHIAKVSLVGAGMRYHSGVAARMFRVLSDQGIDVELISASEIKLSVLIHKKNREVAVRVLHDEFVS